MHLLISYIITQIVLIVINSFSLSNAYSFRRDQKVVGKIRKIALGDMYDEIFGTTSFSAIGKKMLWKDIYIPTFYLIFWQFVWFIQVIVSIVLVIVIGSINNPFDGYNILGWIFTVFLILFFFANSWFWRLHYYLKYLKKVENSKNKYRSRFINWLAQFT